MSLTHWEKYEKMSPKQDKTVPQLVEKYLEKYPELDRDLLRKLIRLENKITNPSELKKLDRYLRKAFQNKNKDPQNTADATIDDAVVEMINEWKKIALRFPLPSEIANETGLLPEQCNEIAWKTRDRTGWSLPNDATIEYATDLLTEVLCLLARKKKREYKDFDYKMFRDDKEIKGIAKLRLKAHLEMLPDLVPIDDLDWGTDYLTYWPNEAMKYGLKNKYKPRNRYSGIKRRFL